MRDFPRSARLLGAACLLLACAACGGAQGGDVTSAGSCVAPYLDTVPPDAPSVAAEAPVAPGDSLTVYGHWYTETCNDTGGHDPEVPMPPVHLTVTCPGGAVDDLGEAGPGGGDMGFSVVVQVPVGTPTGVAKIRDDQEYPSTYRFRVG